VADKFLDLDFHVRVILAKKFVFLFEFVNLSFGRSELQYNKEKENTIIQQDRDQIAEKEEEEEEILSTNFGCKLLLSCKGLF